MSAHPTHAFRPAPAALRAALLLASVAAAASMPAFADKPSPGLYRITTTIDASSMPMGAGSGHVNTMEHCVTLADVERDPEALLGDQPMAKGCDMSDFNFADGQVVINMACSMEGGSMTMAGRGQYDATSYRITNTVAMNFAGMQMGMTSTTAGERIGDCND